MERRKRRDRVGALHAAIARKPDELLLGRRHVEDALIEDRKARTALRHHIRCEAGIAGALVAEAMARAVDDEAALLDRGPRKQAAVRIAYRRVALIGADIAERGAECLAPQHRL